MTNGDAPQSSDVFLHNPTTRTIAVTLPASKEVRTRIEPADALTAGARPAGSADGGPRPLLVCRRRKHNARSRVLRGENDRERHPDTNCRRSRAGPPPRRAVAAGG